MVEYTSKNFMFLKKSKLQHLYCTLEDDELICYKTPTNGKIYMDGRKIIEELVQRIGEKVGDIERLNLNQSINRLEKHMTHDIYIKFHKVRKVGNIYVHSNEGELIAPEKVLELVHNILVWYVSKWENLSCEHLKFEKPPLSNDIDEALKARINEIIMRYEAENIQLKERCEKVEARNRIVEKTLKDAKEKVQETTKYIEEQKVRLMLQEQEHKETQAENIALKKSVQEAHNAMALQERKIRELEKRMEEVKEVSIFSNSKIEEINETYENLQEEALQCEEKVIQIEKGVKSLREIFEVSQVEGVTYEAFYKGFLNLEGQQLRRVYVMLRRLNLLNLTTAMIGNGINKIRKSEVDQVEQLIQKEIMLLGDLSDEEIKLCLYESLLKVCRIKEGKLEDELSFKRNLDTIVEKGYEILSKEKDFQEDDNKLECITTYYMKKIFADFEKKYKESSREIQEEFVTQIYNSFENIPEEQRQELYDNMGVKDTSEEALKNAIYMLGPAAMLALLVNVGGFGAYIGLVSLIHAISELIGVTFAFSVYTGATSLLSFLTGPFLIVLLAGQGYLISRTIDKQQQSLIPLVILQIVTNEACFKSDNKEAVQYERLVSIWQEKHTKYMALDQQRNEYKAEITAIYDEKDALERDKGKYTQEVNSLERNKKIEVQRLIPIVLGSNAVRELASYNKYCEIKLAKEKNEMKKQAANGGFFKSLLNKGITGFNEMNLNFQEQEYQLKLVEEARCYLPYKEEMELLNDYYAKIYEDKQKIEALKAAISKLQTEKTSVELKLSYVEKEMSKLVKRYVDITNQ